MYLARLMRSSNPISQSGAYTPRRSYRELEKRLQAQNILNLYACIAYTQKEDEYLTNDSVAFHQKCGYTLVGEFHQCGYKFDRWYDMVWMEKFLGEHLVPAPDLRPADNR